MSHPINERRFKSGKDARLAKIVRRKNAKLGGTKEFRRINGKVKLTTLTGAQRRARRMAGKRLVRVSRTASARRRGKMTQRLNKRYVREGVLTHNPAFLAAIAEMVRSTGRPELGASLAEAISPSLTSTKLGIYAMEVGDAIDEAAPFNAAYLDAHVLDENTVAFFFEDTQGVTGDGIVRVLKNFGEAELLAKPGDAISEGETSDVYVVTLSVAESKLKDIKLPHESEDADGDEMSEEDAESIFKHSCFEAAIGAASVN